MNKKLFVFFVTLTAVVTSSISSAGSLDQGYALINAGNDDKAAELFCGYAKTNPNDGNTTAEALAMCGRLLDLMSEQISEKAEKKCYWGKQGDPSCMEKEVANLNAKFGPESFRYEHSILYIPYTGSQYKTIRSKFAKSPYGDEAEFYLLLKELKGTPESIIPKVKSFLSKHGSGEWNRKGLLLWARLNEDLWAIHKSSNLIMYNDKVAPEEMLVRAEKFRKEALSTYKKLMSNSGTFEGDVASKEYSRLSANQDDGIVYSITEDSFPGSLAAWGIVTGGKSKVFELGDK